LYDWMEKGYNFIGEIAAVGNYGEQGKSIIHVIEKEMSNEEKWQVLKKIEPDFLSDLIGLKTKIEMGSILLTGEIDIHPFFGKQFKYQLIR